MDTVTKAGKVSAYGFACGQVESKIVAGNRYGGFAEHVYVEMYQEGGVFHIKRVDKGRRTHWHVVDTLAEARQKYNAIKS